MSTTLHSPLVNISRNVGHKGLFAAMAGGLSLDAQQSGRSSDVKARSKGPMTRQYASLHAVVRQEKCVDKFVLAIAWNTLMKDAESTSGEFCGPRLTRLVSPDAGSREDKNERCGHDILALRNLQVDYSSHVAHCGPYRIMAEEVKETTVHRMLANHVDIDALTLGDYLRRFEELVSIRDGCDELGTWYVF